MKKSRKSEFVIFEWAALIFVGLSVAMILAIHNFQMNYEKTNALTEQYFMAEYNEMETKLSICINACQIMSEEDEVKSYAKNGKVESYYDYINLSSVIKKHRKVLPNTDGMIALSTVNDGMCISDNETIELADYLDSIRLDKAKFAETVSAGSGREEYFAPMIDEANSSGFITFLYKHRYYDGAEIYFLINVDKNYFSSQRFIKQDTAFYVVDKSSLAKIGTLNEFKADANGILSKLSFDTQRMNTERIMSRNVCYRPSLYALDTFYVFIDANDYYTLKYALLIALWVALTALIIIIVRLVVKEMRGPLDKLLSLLRGDRKNDNWNFILESVQNMIDQNSELTGKLELNIRQVEKNFWHGILIGTLSDDEVVSGMKELGIKERKGDWQCILFEHDDNELQINLGNDKNEKYLMKNYREVACKYLDEQLNDVCVVDIDKNHFACVIVGKERSLLNEHLLRLLDLGEELYGTRVIIAVGDCVDDISRLNYSYTSAMRMLEQRFWNSEKLIFYQEDLQEEHGIFYYPIEVEQLLVTVVLEGDKEKCGAILNRLLQTNLREIKLDYNNMKEFRFSLTATIKRILRKMNIKVEDIFGDDMNVYLELNAAATPEEFENTVYTVFYKLCDCTEQEINRSQMKTVSKIVNYIEENYGRDISLNDLAEHCRMSQGHINRLLRTSMDISFKEYLDKYRVKKAQELFETTDLTVNEVSEKVGYNYTKSFIRAFKKYLFVSPGEYKKKFEK